MKKLIIAATLCAALFANAQVQMRFVAFNIWGDFFGNPPHERDLAQVEILRSHKPDFIGLQEVTPNYWKSRLISELEKDYALAGRNSSTPILWRKDRFDVIEIGLTLFCPELDKSKGVAWAALQDKQSHKRILVFASHFWWQAKGMADDYVRLLNSRQLYATVTEMAKKFKVNQIVGGGDLNSPITSSAMKELVKLGLVDAQESSPKTDKRATCRDFPVRDANGVYRGVQPELAKSKACIDHIFYSPEGIKPLEFAMDRSQRALDVSDHSPIIFDFIIK